LTILIIFTLTISLIPDSNLYASEDLLPFEYGSILVEFRYKGEINEKHKQPEKRKSFPDEQGNSYIEALAFYEQSTFADRQPNSYYYKTDFYKHFLTKEPYVFISNENGID